jgi:autotransporter-associated beta strand protein
VTASAADFVKLGSNTLRLASSTPSTLNTGKILIYQGDLVLDGTTWTNYGGAVRTFAPSGGIVHLAITNEATLSIGTGGTTPNLRLGYNAGLTGTNELDISSGQLILDLTFGQIYVGDANSTYAVFNQTGGTVLFQNNTNTIAGVLLGSSAGSTGWYNLNGGALITPRVVGGSGTGYFYFNGGTLTPSSTLSASNFVSGFTAAYVGNGGAVIDTTNIDVTVSQPLLNGGTGGLTKLGSAALTLNGTNSYVGPTLVSNGKLIVSGSVGSSAVTVSGGTLTGSGSINGAVTINTNGNLILGGLDPINTGTLTVNSNLNLAGGIFAKLNKSLTQSNDAAVVTGSVAATGPGTLTLSNVGPALVVNDRFQLFNKAVVNGGNLTISPAPGAGLFWQNQLAVDGSVVVVNTLVALNPTNIVSSVSGGQLNLSWPADHLGWRLQAQTNGLGTNWVDVPGATLTNGFTVPIDPANGSVFFRLISP